jgi:hypothetical protein
MVVSNTKKIREKTDDFVFENEEITRQIFSDLTNLVIEKNIDLTPSEKTDVLVDIIFVIYKAEVVQRVYDRSQEEFDG